MDGPPPNATVIVLEPLSAADCAELVSDLGEVVSETVERIVETAEAIRCSSNSSSRRSPRMERTWRCLRAAGAAHRIDRLADSERAVIERDPSRVGSSIAARSPRSS